MNDNIANVKFEIHNFNIDSKYYIYNANLFLGNFFLLLNNIIYRIAKKLI